MNNTDVHSSRELRLRLGSIKSPVFQEVVANLRALKGHSITVEEHSDRLNCKCVEYAMGLYGHERYPEHRIDLNHDYWMYLYPHEPFARWLTYFAKLKEAHENSPGLAFYYSNKWEHAAIRLPNGRYKSKWGDGHIFEHEKFEVPLDYGWEVKVFEMPMADEAVDLYAEFKAFWMKYCARPKD